MEDLDVWLLWFLALAANAAGVLLMLYFGAAGMATTSSGKVTIVLITALAAVALPGWLSVRLMRKKRFGLGIAATFLLLPSLFAVGLVYA